MLADGVSFDAIFTGDDEAAVGALATLEARGVRVPEDVAVVGFDDQSLAAILHPPLTTVRAPTEQVGQAGGAPIDQAHSHGQRRAVDVVAHRTGVSPLLRVRLILGQERIT